jgi:hypothetical protein
MLSQEHLIALEEQLAHHRAALQDIWEAKAKHEQAIAAIKATLQASGVPCESSPYDGAALSSTPLIHDEAQRYLEHALGGPAAITKRPTCK